MRRNLKPETVAKLKVRNAQRLKAAKLILEGASYKEVRRRSGVTNKVYYSVKGRLASGGLEAVPVSVSGSPPGRRMRLTLADEELLLGALCRGVPSDFGLDGLLWSRDKAASLMNAALDGRGKLSAAAQNAYLKKWDLHFSAVRPLSLNSSAARAFRRWLDVEGAALNRAARNAGGRLHWAHMRRLRAGPSDSTTTCVQIAISVGRCSTHWLCLADTSAQSVLDALEMIGSALPGIHWLVLVSHLSDEIQLSESDIQRVAPSLRISKCFGSIKLISACEKARGFCPPVVGSIGVPDSGYLLDIVDGVLLLKYRIAGTDFVVAGTDDLRAAWLPPTPFSLRPTAVADEPELCRLLLDCLTEQIRRSTLSKSLRQAVMATKSTLLKLFEWSWLRGIYRPQSLSAQDFEELALDLAKGGWSMALRIQERAAAHIRNADRSQLEAYFNDNRSRRSISVKAAFARDIGTNAFGREMHFARQLLSAALELPPEVKEFVPKASLAATEGMIATQLRQVMAAVNLLADIDSPGRLETYPFLDTVGLARRLGRTGGRTANITPDMVGSLLLQSMSTLRDVAPPLLDVVGEYIERIMAKPAFQHKYSVDMATLKKCASLGNLEQAIGGSITKFVGGRGNPDSNGLALNYAVDQVYTAAVIVIAFLNARRRDELIHPLIGMYCGSLRKIDANLDVYAADFYLEKRTKDYSTFLVSNFTVLAMSTLEKLSALARKWRGAKEFHGEQAKGKCMLAEMPSLLPTRRQQPTFFQFDLSAGSGRAHYFVLRAIGEKAAWSFGLHTGRRAYALIHHYRFECSTLLSIAYQFGSFSIESIRTYINDGPANAGFARAVQYGPVASEQLRSNIDEVLVIERELEEVSKEKLISVVSQILAGHGGRAGPFAKLVTRFRQKMIGRLENDLSSPSSGAEQVAKLLLAHGHRSRPFPHGNCNAAEGRRNVGAKCRAHSGRAPIPERASVAVCTSCPFHDFTSNHQQAIRIFRQGEIERLAAVSPDSVISKSISRSIETIDTWMDIRQARLAAVGVR